MTVPLLYNPVAAGGRGRRRARQAQQLLANAGIDVLPFATERQGHAREMARELAPHHDHILVLGGDGTISEAACGILESDAGTVLGALPGGTGNDFLRDFGILDLETAVDRIRAGSMRRVDASLVTWPDGSRWSINLVGAGFLPEAAHACNTRFKRLGPVCYVVAVVSELVRLRHHDVTLTLDGEAHRLRIPLAAVCNSVHTGRGMKIAPDARPDDGLLDVLWVDQLGRLELAGIFPKIFPGTHIKHPKVHLARARTVRIEMEPPTPLLLDGEVVGHTPLEMEIRPGALRLFA